MNKEEFELQLKSTDSGRQEALSKESVIDAISESLRQRIETVVDNLKKRDSKYTEYIGYVSKFNFVSTNAPSVSIFPGIRTVSTEDIDPEELAETSSRMSNLAIECESLTVSTNQQVDSVLEDIKNLYTALKAYATLYQGIYVEETNILETLNSIYDVGSLYRK